MIKNLTALVMVSLLCLAGRMYGAEPSKGFTITVQPEQILIGAGYNGKQVLVSGKIPSDASALVRVTGQPEHAKLKQKGRALGFLWMNLGSVEITKVPNVFLLYLPGEFHNTKEKGQQAWQAFGIGLDGVRQQADIVAQEGNKDELFDEYVKLKRKSGLYGIVENAVHYGSDNGPMKSFDATLALPAALPQGTYKIEVFAIENNTVDAHAVRKIEAKEIGEPAWISSLARKHGILYGVLAVLVAIIAGLLTGILFKGEKGAH